MQLRGSAFWVEGTWQREEQVSRGGKWKVVNGAGVTGVSEHGGKCMGWGCGGSLHFCTWLYNILWPYAC